MKTWIKYGLINAILGIVIGIYINMTAINDDSFIFIMAAPIAAFLTAGVTWKIIMKDKYDGNKIYITGLIAGTISHYVTFILVSIGMNICFWTTGKCVSSLGEPPLSIFSMLTAGFLYSFFSLMWFGWITAPYSVIIGFILKRVEDRKNEC